MQEENIISDLSHKQAAEKCYDIIYHEILKGEDKFDYCRIFIKIISLLAVTFLVGIESKNKEMKKEFRKLCIVNLFKNITENLIDNEKLEESPICN